MKIYLASDIHVEFHRDYHGPSEKVDLVLLAGDIHVGLKSVEIASWYRNRFQAPVIFVAGNHEFYGSDIDNMTHEFRLATKGLDQIYFLENDGLEIGGVRFLGCTLWSDFSIHGTEKVDLAQQLARQYIADFQVIHQKGLLFTPSDAAERFRTSFSWLEEELSKSYEGKTVVISHFAPHDAAIHPAFSSKGTDELTPYFTANCASLMQRFPIDAWLFGHTHYSIDTVVERGTRLISNQRGYPSERWSYTRYKPKKVIDL